MSTTMKEVLVSLRAKVGQLRVAYNQARVDHVYRVPRYDHGARDRWKGAQVKMSYLVPLYRAMSCVVQQSVTEGDAGIRLYKKKYEALCYRIRDVLTYNYTGRSELFFGEGMATIEVLVPDLTKPVTAWEIRTIGELIKFGADQLATERREALGRQMAAENARKVFLTSLTPEQRTLLQQALESAKLKGTHAVSFNLHDLV